MKTYRIESDGLISLRTNLEQAKDLLRSNLLATASKASDDGHAASYRKLAELVAEWTEPRAFSVGEEHYRIVLEVNSTNVPLKEGFRQVCVWPATSVGNDKVAEFEAYMAQTFNGVRVQYLEEILTNPTPNEVGTGGRNDTFFAVHADDVDKFAVPRLGWGIRWLEDVYGNGQGYLYPDRVAAYKSWNAQQEA